jgi:hypothetical protein
LMESAPEKIKCTKSFHKLGTKSTFLLKLIGEHKPLVKETFII